MDTKISYINHLSHNKMEFVKDIHTCFYTKFSLLDRFHQGIKISSQGIDWSNMRNLNMSTHIELDWARYNHYSTYIDLMYPHINY